MSAAPVESLLVRAGEGRTVSIGALRVVFKVTSDQTADAFGLYELTLAPRRMGATPHVHKVLTEIFQVVSGKLDVLVGDETVVAGPGDIVTVPPGLPHAFANRGDRSATFMLSFTPSLRREGFFEGLADLFAAGRLGDRDAVDELLHRFDQVSVAAPPGWDGIDG